jgi:hypothetical protein
MSHIFIPVQAIYNGVDFELNAEVLTWDEFFACYKPFEDEHLQPHQPHQYTEVVGIGLRSHPSPGSHVLFSAPPSRSSVRRQRQVRQEDITKGRGQPLLNRHNKEVARTRMTAKLSRFMETRQSTKLQLPSLPYVYIAAFAPTDHRSNRTEALTSSFP